MKRNLHGPTEKEPKQSQWEHIFVSQGCKRKGRKPDTSQITLLPLAAASKCSVQNKKMIKLPAAKQNQGQGRGQLRFGAGFQVDGKVSEVCS